jgi:cytochrome c biogenesis protein CcdA
MSSGAISFAFLAGSIATVNPCGFALLAAYLGRRLGSEDTPHRRRSSEIARVRNLRTYAAAVVRSPVTQGWRVSGATSAPLGQMIVPSSGSSSTCRK